MKSKNTICEILNRLEKQLPIIEAGDIIETLRTEYPKSSEKRERKNIILEGVEMTAPFATSRESKEMLKKDKSKLVQIYKDLERGDILSVKAVNDNKIVVENLSIKEEFRKDFEIEKLDVIKGRFNVVKRKSIDLIKTLEKLTVN